MNNNDERHYDSSKIAIVFALAAFALLAALLLLFRQDNDREWKHFQREFRKLDVEKAKSNLKSEKERLEAEAAFTDLSKQVADAQTAYKTKGYELLPFEKTLTEKQTKYALITQKYQFAKAEYDSLKYSYEEALAEHSHEAGELKDKFYKLEKQLNDLKLKQQEADGELKVAQTEVDHFRESLDTLSRDLRRLTTKYDVYERKLKRSDPEEMTMANRLASVVRDLPVADMLNPSLKVEQTVLKDITDNVNFMRVPKVDRCTTCHQGIMNPDFKDAPQPFRSHPNLELFLFSNSAHPIDDFGCTSCHDGRGRGTSFTSSAHTPRDEKQAKEWKDKYHWRAMHHWPKPMFPLQYTEAGCLKCHSSEPNIKGAEKLNLGMRLIEQSGCYSCHTINKYQGWPQTGPTLHKLSAKFNKEWAYRWIKNPQAFRHDTNMPSFFGQTNNSDPESVKRTDQEIHAMVSYLYAHNEAYKMEKIPVKGTAENGKELVASLGCFACHQIKKEASDESLTTDSMRHHHGPNLINLGSKTSEQWLYHWLKNPSSYHAKTRMPSLRLSDQEAADIAAFLVEDKDPEFEKDPVPEVDEAEITSITQQFLTKMMPTKEAEEKVAAMSLEEKMSFAGEKLIRHYGCFACHEIAGFENEKPIGTDLSDQGNKPANKLDFGSVHDIGHSPHAWYHAKLKNPRLFDKDKIKDPYEKLKMPNFHFTDEEVEAITTVILGLVEERPGEAKLPASDAKNELVNQGRQIVQQFNCQSCHKMEGVGGNIQESVKDWLINYDGRSENDANAMKTSFSPPDLIGEGAKVQTDWLFRFIHDPEIIRPWLKVRMPTFPLSDAQINSLVRYFNYLDNQDFPFETIHKNVLSSEEIDAAKKLFSPDYFGCTQCHIVGSQMPGGSPENWAPDFALAQKRLKPDWVIRWIKDPQSLLPGTKMPTFFDLQYFDASGPDDLLGGDEDAQIRAMRDYIFSLEDGKSQTASVPAPASVETPQPTPSPEEVLPSEEATTSQPDSVK